MSLVDAFSEERLNRYFQWAGNQQADAFALYLLNVQLSEAFYTSLHSLEITLRNAVSKKMEADFGADWLHDSHDVLTPYQRSKIQEARQKVGLNGTNGKVIAELTFGFWTSLFGRQSNRLWGPHLRRIFDPDVPLQRRQINDRLGDIRVLRNRIAHHEPIIHRDLARDHREICEITGRLPTDALAWCNQYCRFRTVHPGVDIIVGNLKNPQLDLL